MLKPYVSISINEKLISKKWKNHQDGPPVRRADHAGNAAIHDNDYDTNSEHYTGIS